MSTGREMLPKLNRALDIHGDSIGPSSHRDRFRGASKRSGTCEEPFDISYDSVDIDDLDGGINLGLDDEPGSLLGYLWTRQEDVRRRGVRSVSGLSFDVEVTIYDCLILQLYHERVSDSERKKEVATKLSRYIDMFRR